MISSIIFLDHPIGLVRLSIEQGATHVRDGREIVVARHSDDIHTAVIVRLVRDCALGGRSSTPRHLG
jgi:hypothetical protein